MRSIILDSHDQLLFYLFHFFLLFCFFDVVYTNDHLLFHFFHLFNILMYLDQVITLLL